VYTLEAAHNPEVAGSILPPLRKALETRPFAYEAGHYKLGLVGDTHGQPTWLVSQAMASALIAANANHIRPDR
jgi:hypothetical protein